MFKDFLQMMSRNPVSLIGSAITTACAVLFLILFGIYWMGFEGGPYQGIISFLIIPAVFLLGLLLIPVGIWVERRRSRRAGDRELLERSFPIIDLNVFRTRSLVVFFLVLTALNVVILALATYKGLHVMDSTGFCGQACHTVMHPEHTAYARSPHARVNCVDCHIGPGADWFVKSKLSGAWQVVAVAFDLFPRPIPTPVENLRPARETCEQCHWPAKFVGDKLRVITHFEEDRENTELQTVLLLRVGGLESRRSQGIHWHVDPANLIRYRADATRSTIYEVELAMEDGSFKRYMPAEDSGDTEESEWRVMDCVDCHNRPTHIYRMPGEEIDQALKSGLIDRSLPYIRREGRKALEQEYVSQDAAREGIRESIISFYAEEHPEVLDSRAEAVEAAIAALGNIYSWNVFPTMNVTWGTYPDHIGHVENPGCFRCHNDEHTTEEGETISQDCETCHSLLAMEEEDPEILQQLNP